MIPSELPALTLTAEVNQTDRLIGKIKEVLARAGFTELISYTLTNEGDQALANPLAADKGYLRRDLITNLQAKLSANLNHLLFEKDALKLFEIGQVFPNEREATQLAMAIGYGGKKDKQTEELARAWGQIKTTLGVSFEPVINQTETGEWLELEMTYLITGASALSAPDLSVFIKNNQRYQSISPYPRIIRDVALFTPAGTGPNTIAAVIKTQASELLVEGPVLFDEFKKDDKEGQAKKAVDY